MQNTENTAGSTPDNTPSDQSRPFGFWITVVDRLLAAEFATAFEDEGITRRDWRILNVIDGTVPRGPELPDRKLRHLSDLGWIERTADGWALTADGSAAKVRLSAAVEEIRAQVAGALDPEEFAAMAAALEKLAHGLGYEEGQRLPRRHPGERRDSAHHGHGHDHDHRHDHDHDHHDHDHGHGHGRHDHGHDHGRGHDHGHGGQGHDRNGNARHEGRGRDESRHGMRHPHGRGLHGDGHALAHIHLHLHKGRRHHG